MNPPRSQAMSAPAVLKSSVRFFFHLIRCPLRTASFTCMALMALPGDSRDMSCSVWDSRDI